MSRLLTEGLFNTRDLGGMKTAEGRRIRSGLLFRSGMLAPATENDIRLLESFGIAAVVDFRAKEEIDDKPDPKLKGAAYHYLPVDSEDEVGLRRDDEAEMKLIDIIIDRIIKEPLFSVHYMSEMYRRLVTSSYSTKKYTSFVDIVAKSEGPVLWHCTAGKDRAGFAAIIIEKLLGVSDEDIMDDYLFTNECLSEDTEKIIAMLEARIGDKSSEAAVRQLFAADRLYLEAMHDQVDKTYGSWDAFFATALRIDDNKRNILINKYTEQT